jgi:hypothetical protein
MARRLVVTVCPRERGVVVLPVEPRGRACRLDAPAIVRHLHALIGERNLADRVCVREACAGGCTGAGPNIGVAIYPMPAPGERVDQIAIGWKTYVYSLPTLDCLAQVIEENLGEARASRPRRRKVGEALRGVPLPCRRRGVTAGRRRSAPAAPSPTRR